MYFFQHQHLSVNNYYYPDDWITFLEPINLPKIFEKEIKSKKK